MKKLFLFLLAAQKGVISENMLCEKSGVTDDTKDACQQALSALPPECDSFEVIKGNVLEARTLIFGEHHKRCESAKVLCTQSLLSIKNKKNKKKSTLLLESLGHDEKILCKERGYEKLSDDCRGWNLPKKQNDIMQTIYWKSHVMSGPGGLFENFHQKIKELQSKPENIQILEITTFIKIYIESNKQYVKQDEKNYAEFSSKHPGFYSDKGLTVKQGRFRQKVLEKTKKIIEEKRSMHDVMLYIMNRANQYRNSLNAYYLDPAASIEKQNEAMFETIQKTSKENNNIVVYAGDAHVNLFHTKTVKMTDQNKRMIRNLYNKLDEFATENPYAVLSCKV